MHFNATLYCASVLGNLAQESKMYFIKFHSFVASTISQHITLALYHSLYSTQFDVCVHE